MQDITIDDIDDTENFVRTKLLKMTRSDGEMSPETANSYFGSYFDNPHNFRFSLEDRFLILKYAKYAKYLSDIVDITTEFGFIDLKSNLVADCPNECTLSMIHQNRGDSLDDHKSRTHYFLALLIKTADQNVERKSEGYRFNQIVKSLACYYRMIAGPLAYESLQVNLALSLPSLSSVNRYIRKIHSNLTEGDLQVLELKKYLEERGLPLIVSLSEDGSKLTGTVQYDVRTNQLMGFSLPLDENGMPKKNYFGAKSANEIIKHFTKKHVVGNNMNVVMAQPIADIPAFCLLLYSTAGSYTASDVSHRWKYIVRKLRDENIEVLTFSSDSDQKYNSAMRWESRLGERSSLGEGKMNKPFPIRSIKVPYEYS